MESYLSISHTVNRDTAAKDQLEDGNGKRKAVIGLGEANTFGNDGIKTSKNKLSLALPQSHKKDLLCGEEIINGGVSAACKENKKPHSNVNKLSLEQKQPFSDNLASSSFRAKSDNSRLSRKLSLRPLGELNQVSKTEVLAQTDMELEMNQNEDARKWCSEFENSGMEVTSMHESIVVLDSDDSGKEEETVSSRSRLSLARRRALKCSRP